MCSDHPPDLISGDHSSVKRPDRVITISDSGYTVYSEASFSFRPHSRFLTPPPFCTLGSAALLRSVCQYTGRVPGDASALDMARGLRPSQFQRGVRHVGRPNTPSGENDDFVVRLSAPEGDI